MEGQRSTGWNIVFILLLSVYSRKLHIILKRVVSGRDIFGRNLILVTVLSRLPVLGRTLS